MRVRVWMTVRFRLGIREKFISNLTRILGDFNSPEVSIHNLIS
jgi:hypothetical protein